MRTSRVDSRLLRAKSSQQGDDSLSESAGDGPDGLLGLLDVPDGRRRQAQDAWDRLSALFERVVVLPHDERVRVRLLRVMRLVENHELDVAQVIVSAGEHVQPDLRRQDDDVGGVELSLPLFALPKVDALRANEALDSEACLRLDDVGLLVNKGRGRREEDEKPAFGVRIVVGGQRRGGDLAQQEDRDECLATARVGPHEAVFEAA